MSLITTAQDFFPLHNGAMENRIREFRKRAGLTLVELSERAGMSRSLLTEFELGTKNPNTKRLGTLAEALGVSAADLLESRKTVSVVGYVGAGAEIYAIDDHEKGGGIDEVPAPPGAGSSAVAVVVRGDSMWPKFEDGDVLIYHERKPPADLINKTCVVELEDGRTLVKKIRRGAEDSFTLVSHNAQDIEDVYVRWAARVAFVIPA